MRRLAYALPLALLSACGPGGEAPAQAGGNAGLSRQATTNPFVATPVAKLANPWAMAFLPDGRLIVTEKGGTVRIVTQGGAKSRPLGGVPKVAYEGQGGLLDIALSPGFASDRLVYLTYAEPGRGGSGLALARGALVVDPSGGGHFDAMTVLWRQQPKGEGGQFGAIVAFSPDGRFLYLTSGERQRFIPAQDPDQALGKILRLTIDGKPAPGNPGAGRIGAAVVRTLDPPPDSEAAKTASTRKARLPGPNLTPAETWTTGHRNPYGLAFAPDGKLWEVEMGPRGGDELNLIVPGANYGWPVVSNGDNYDGVPIPRHATHPEFKPPALYWNPVISPSSLIFYSGALFPAWRGSALIGGLSSQALIRVAFDGKGGAREAERFDMRERIRCVRQGPDGAVWLLEDGEDGSPGRLLRLTPKP